MNLLKIAFSLSIINLFLFMVLASLPNEAATTSMSKPNIGPTMSALPSTIPTPSPVNSGTTVTQVKPTTIPDTIVPTSAPPTPDNRCIIVIDGNQYDVTSFKNQHSGGDIFQCGTDMSSIFHNQHDNSYLSSLKRI